MFSQKSWISIKFWNLWTRKIKSWPSISVVINWPFYILLRLNPGFFYEILTYITICDVPINVNVAYQSSWVRRKNTFDENTFGKSYFLLTIERISLVDHFSQGMISCNKSKKRKKKKNKKKVLKLPFCKQGMTRERLTRLTQAPSSLADIKAILSVTNISSATESQKSIWQFNFHFSFHVFLAMSSLSRTILRVSTGNFKFP